MDNYENEIVIRCECGEEVLVVTHADGDFYLCMFDRQFTKYGWRHRLHLMWRIIRHGKPYTDQICISENDATQLMMFLQGSMGVEQ